MIELTPYLHLCCVLPASAPKSDGCTPALTAPQVETVLIPITREAGAKARITLCVSSQGAPFRWWEGRRVAVELFTLMQLGCWWTCLWACCCWGWGGGGPAAAAGPAPAPAAPPAASCPAQAREREGGWGWVLGRGKQRVHLLLQPSTARVAGRSALAARHRSLSVHVNAVC